MLPSLMSAPPHLWGCVCTHLCSVSLGVVPSGSALQGLPTFLSGERGSGTVRMDEVEDSGNESPAIRAARQTTTLMSLLGTQATWSAPPKMAKVWLGEGLGSVPKQTHERMIRWEFMDLAEFRPRTVWDKINPEANTEKLVILPRFEVAQTRKRPVTSIITWVQCFSRYTAAMAKQFPECTPGFMSHLLTVLKAYGEVEEPAWRLYDEAFREKMASTGTKTWSGMDVSLYQELCGGQPRKRAMGPQADGRGAATGSNAKRSLDSRKPVVCWQYNDGVCSYGSRCKFPHVCEVCQGNHARSQCQNAGTGGKRPRPN